MLRDSHSKNSPRDTYIVEQLPDSVHEFLLIRKLNQSLRQRLYKSLPEELIHAPRNPYVNNDRKPKRKAAIKANEKLKTQIFKINTPKKTFKHGWLEADQMEESLILIPNPELPYQEHDVSSSHTPTNSMTETTTLSAPSDSDSTSEDLAWDASPEQITLQDAFIKETPNPWASTPFVESSQHSVIPPAFPRNRMNATSYTPLSRSNAFRHSRRNDAFLATPLDQPPIPFPVSPARSYSSPYDSTRRSRIPLPVHPSQVILSEVTDISLLPQSNQDPETSQPRRSTRTSVRPQFYGVNSTAVHATRRRREAREMEETTTQACASKGRPDAST